MPATERWPLIVKEPGTTPLRRVRTHLPAVAKGGPNSKVAQSCGLSRLPRYRSGNCTFVTSSRHSNRRASDCFQRFVLLPSVRRCLLEKALQSGFNKKARHLAGNV